MKTAEEFIKEKQGLIVLNDYTFTDLNDYTFTDMIWFMKHYAKEACKEQRKICAKVWAKGDVIDPLSVSERLRNAPEPKL